MTKTFATRFFSFLLFVAFAWGMLSVPTATAQQEQPANAREMHHGEAPTHEARAGAPTPGAHAGAALHSNRPLQRATMKALVLPALADTLGLSADQTRRLEEMRRSLVSEQEARREELHAQKSEAHEQLQDGEMPDPEAVESKMKAIASQRVALKTAPYETATEMRQVLTPEQQDRLSELSRRARHHEVMANMTMQEHMHIKRALGGTQHGGAQASGVHDSRKSTPGLKREGSAPGENHGQHHGGAGE